MSRRAPLGRFLAAPLRQKALAVEAAGALVLARLIRRLPARVYLRMRVEDDAGPPAPAVAAEIRHAVEAVAACLPVATACLERALAARWMLARRGWRPVLHLGLARDAEARAAPGEGRAAHAWLTLGGEVVVGGAGLDRYAAVARFG